ncbi:hypothetical protein G7K_5700-t1 [Saitoella complicata NRRL Y-17804]|uniref:histidine kinase n=2 Tax=Saitoella complicata (strain BCRC 22490 / CBS 7301 / JCM 7358 / NBRC 10748 / NRRL Y-17804) TaxID=698492 RepID=A0A0E9NP41_SAICN|nr:hypothetical protein G7K_5700-t1 [Saitoella complicata NRRL Y-17804]
MASTTIPLPTPPSPTSSFTSPADFLTAYSTGTLLHSSSGPTPPLLLTDSPTARSHPLDLIGIASPDEHDRVRDLWRYIDLSPEETAELIRYPRMLKEFCGTGAANVSLMGVDRQFMLAEVGFEEWAGRCFARMRVDSICAHTLLLKHQGEGTVRERVFTVEDTREDWRFRSKSYVVSHPHIRSYAGVPLVSEGGYNLGTLATVHTSPRIWTDRERRILLDLSAAVVRELELVAERRRAEEGRRMQNSIRAFTARWWTSSPLDKRGMVREVLGRAVEVGGECLGCEGMLALDVRDAFAGGRGGRDEGGVCGEIARWEGMDGRLPRGSEVDVRWVREFVAAHPNGCVLDREPASSSEAICPLLSVDSTSAIVVPIYDHLSAPYALLVASLSSPKRHFLEMEVEYLSALGSACTAELLKRQIAAADHAKTVFISNISHELRSPLHGVLACGELLRKTELGVMQRRFVETMEGCGRTLMEVLSSVLDYSKMSRREEGSPAAKGRNGDEKEVREVDLARACEEVVDSCHAAFEFQQQSTGSCIDALSSEPKDMLDGSGVNVQVVLDVQRRLEGWIVRTAHAPAIRRCLMNLLGNSLKYTPNEESHWIRVSLAYEAGSVRMIVEDSGKGMTPEFVRERLFRAFTQEDSFHSGVGLGMTIVKNLVENLLSGTIEVESEFGRGTKITIMFPVEMVSLSPSPSPSAHGVVVDEVSKARMMVRGKKVYMDVGNPDTPFCAALFTASVRTYLEEWYGSTIVQDITHADVIVGGGQSVLTRKLLADPHFPCTEGKTVLALCSNADLLHLNDNVAVNARIVDFVSLPCGPAKLARSLEYCLAVDNRSKTNEALISPVIKMDNVDMVAPPVSTTDEVLPRVLVVEDNPINAMILSAYLSKRGILHQKAFNGALAVDTVKNDREGFDLVLMDLQMPVMDGFEASEAIRSYEAEVSDEGYERKKTRICALTGLDTGDDREKARRKGIDDFLTKPVSLDKMDRVIEDWQNRRAKVEVLN